MEIMEPDLNIFSPMKVREKDPNIVFLWKEWNLSSMKVREKFR